ncbi:glycosyltransferase family 2 protein [Sistotremastrum niveocremeum HHB9708]|uniref:chitin synthase n=2 Tax=Sistotremastraceae TaxID=3402574 RepID=A0A164UTB8_9AGAM|nr:glycosyltransferase family 2 protein [Sistotremastrum niveocremeum HHB9708]KZT42700.1 hypothetical protein SISSUDRAFT_979743 [Sistotremastrum suecicum HHB10207 ss-3]
MPIRDQRPPRAVPPRSQTQNINVDQPPPSYQSDSSPSLYSPRPRPVKSTTGISFQENERGDRDAPLSPEPRDGRYSNAYLQQPLPPTPRDDGTQDFGERVGRKKSLVRPDREKIEPGHRQWHYRSHAAQLENEGTGRLGLFPSTTGNIPQNGQDGLRRGKSFLARDEDVQESGLSLFTRGATLRRKRPATQGGPTPSNAASPGAEEGTKRGCFDNIAPGPKDAWMIYCYIITIFVPSPLLSGCGIRTPEAQRAWREKMGLLAIILLLMAGVGFLTFGFTQTVCGKPPTRFQSGSIGSGSVIIHGYDYDMSTFKHPAVNPTFNGNTNPLFEGGFNAAGMDASFLFQNTHGKCAGMLSVASNSTIRQTGTQPDWIFPCNLYNQYGTSGVNLTGYGSEFLCHDHSASRQQLAKMVPQGQVYYTWDQVKDPSKNLAVYESNVLDLNLLQWLDRSQVSYPAEWDTFKKQNATFAARDISMYILRTGQRDMASCLQDLVTVGFIDTNTIGCVASQVVLWVSLVFIIGVVAIKFAMAVIFGWFLSWQLGAFKGESYEQRMRRAAEIEQWTDDIYRPAPGRYRPTVQKNGLSAGGKAGKRATTFLPVTSRFSKAVDYANPRPGTTYGNVDPLSYMNKRNTTMSTYGNLKGSHLSPPETPNFRGSRSSTSLGDGSRKSNSDPSLANCPFPLNNVVPQPPPDYEPFNFPLEHAICLVTAYSESIEGLRTTLDSLATTDYPNSHKLIMVIADGMVRGAGNSLTTPEIVLSMMKELVVPVSEVEPHSYVAIADGHKRHNMARVYAGFYDYDDNTVEKSKQQRVPIVLVAKCGNPLEASDAKPGNRGKRDSQIVLMAFLQKVMFDERMTTFEYEFFNSIWRVSGISPDRYEIVLMVDADTKVFPDSLTRMVACMAHDEEIMGLCGETKIANKAETWVTMIQVFEYYISHHLTKAFESMFGGVTCLPGCFSMYRIKAPKGDSGYWVPILANPDIVEHYSENVVDTLHKKNLLLLGEDRYLTTLMLKTFPKRKMLFCPQAVCKTVVPDTFRVLLSQRRRWINSTVHNLTELLFVRDLCGTFCFSMQFVVFMELAGTLVLPAAISFTIYLIIISIIPHHTNTTIPLILLGIILGLPGLLIVVTSRKIAYIGWMLVYLLSLPIWNFVLPAYAFWHFDDFSWGQTRKVQGDKGGDHGDKDGEFDSSHIVMKRWAEFERDRRWKSGTQSRDSMYYDGSRADNNKRYSLVSSETTALGPSSHHSHQSPFDSGESMPPSKRHDPTPLLTLPTPLAVSSRPSGSSPAASARTSEDTPPLGTYDYIGNHRSGTSPGSDTRSYSHESFAHSDQEPILPQQSPRENYGRTSMSLESQLSRNAPAGAYRHGTLDNAHAVEVQNPYRRSTSQAAGYDDAYTTEPEELPQSSSRTPSRSASRGVSLVDQGPVPSGDAVRRVSRQGAPRRSTSQAPQNRYSRTPGSSQPTSPIASPSSSSNVAYLPPGAARPSPYPYGYQ